jgi:hypothetical protein
MRGSRELVGVAASVAFLCGACHSSPLVTVTLSNASFATTGGNLFNCTSPEQPADAQSLSTSGIDCNPAQMSKDVYSQTPVSSTYQLGCGDGNAAVLVVSCGAADGGNADAFSGTVALGINPDCSPTDGGLPENAQVFAFGALAPGASQSQSLSSCANYGNFCPTSNPCVFNVLNATVTVTNALVP